MVIRYPFDILGSTAIVKFPYDLKKKDKVKFAKELMEQQGGIKTVLEKIGKFSGRLRKMQTSFVAGEKTKEILYRENGCVFRFNVESTYFSPRLSNERKELAGLIKKDEEVLVMFAGVSPFSIVLGKLSNARRIYSNELNREANKYGELNIQLNKLKDKVILVPGDIKRVAKKISMSSPPTRPSALRAEIPKKYDVIVMPRPQLKDSFLKEAFMLSKKGTRVYYYDFCLEENIEKILEKVKSEAKKAKRKIKILKYKTAGEIGAYKIRLRIDFIVIN